MEYFKKKIIIKFQGINDRDIVKKLTNSDIIINYYQLPKLDNNQYYWRDLINCSVINIEGYNIGKVINLIDNGIHEILVIKNKTNHIFSDKDVLIPFVNTKIIKKIDLIKKIIIVDWNINF